MATESEHFSMGRQYSGLIFDALRLSFCGVGAAGLLVIDFFTGVDAPPPHSLACCFLRAPLKSMGWMLSPASELRGVKQTGQLSLSCTCGTASEAASNNGSVCAGGANMDGHSLSDWAIEADASEVALGLRIDASEVTLGLRIASSSMHKTSQTRSIIWKSSPFMLLRNPPERGNRLNFEPPALSLQ